MPNEAHCVLGGYGRGCPVRKGEGRQDFTCHLGERYPLDLEVAATFVVTIVGPSCFRMGASMQVLIKYELCC